MPNVHELDGLEKLELVVRDGNKFKIRLGIGEDAYQSLKLAKGLQTLWDVKGAAGAGAAAAASPVVAGTFFSSGGLLSALGWGAAATTPVGWVVAAAVASGGAYYGVMSLAGKYTSSRVEKIPKFLNTPIDLLGATLFDLIGGLALKVAILSNDIDEVERDSLVDYFVEVWGIDKEYIRQSLPILEDQVRGRNLKEMVKALVEFQLDNPDCNPEAMKKDILELLNEIVIADGEIDEREELALGTVESELNKHLALHATSIRSAKKVIDSASDQVSGLAKGLSNYADRGLSAVSEKTGRIAEGVGFSLGKALGSFKKGK